MCHIYSRMDRYCCIFGSIRFRLVEIIVYIGESFEGVILERIGIIPPQVQQVSRLLHKMRKLDPFISADTKVSS